MPATSVVVCDEKGLRIGRARADLSASDMFAVAQTLIETATKKIVTDAADAALVHETVRNPESFKQ